MHAEDLHITEIPEGFRLRAFAHGESVSQSFTYAELIARSQTPYRWRLAPPAEPPSGI
jgi:hypothetical protein